MTKELESLETLKFLVDSYSNFEFDFTIIETALKDYEKQKQLVQTLQDKIYVKEMKYAKQEKALEIVKEKEVDIYGIKNSIDVYDYNAGIENEDNFENRLLTQEEYELLKEVLLCG